MFSRYSYWIDWCKITQSTFRCANILTNERDKQSLLCSTKLLTLGKANKFSLLSRNRSLVISQRVQCIFEVYFKDSEKMSYLFNFTILCTVFRKNSTIFTVIYKYVVKSSII